MIQPEKAVSELPEEELPLELPAPDGGLESETDSSLSEDDADLGLDAEEAPIGLELVTGLEEPPPDEPAPEEESASWILESEPSEDLDEPEVEAKVDNENGWTEGSEPVADQPYEELEPESGRLGNAHEDAGDEGFGDEAGLELEVLPPLEAGTAPEEEEALDPGLDPELATEIAALAVADGGQEIAPGVFALRVGVAGATLDLLAAGAAPASRVVATEGCALAWDDSQLLAAADHESAPEPRTRKLERPAAIAAISGPAAALVALSNERGVRVSLDGGRTFGEPVRVGPGAEAPAMLTFGAGPVGRRLWAAQAMGGLYASDDAGASFFGVRPELRVLRLASDGARGLLVLARTADGTCEAALSLDAGASFATLALPVAEPERILDLQLCAETVLCALRGAEAGLAYGRLHGSWRSLPAYARSPARLLEERGKLVLYFVAGHGGKAFLVRERLGELAASRALIAELPAEAGAVLALEGVSYGEASILQLVTERGWYRVTAAQEGLTR